MIALSSFEAVHDPRYAILRRGRRWLLLLKPPTHPECNREVALRPSPPSGRPASAMTIWSCASPQATVADCVEGALPAAGVVERLRLDDEIAQPPRLVLMNDLDRRPPG